MGIPSDDSRWNVCIISDDFAVGRGLYIRPIAVGCGQGMPCPYGCGHGYGYGYGCERCGRMGMVPDDLW